jgi:hypothetical protein
MIDTACEPFEKRRHATKLERFDRRVVQVVERTADLSDARVVEPIHRAPHPCCHLLPPIRRRLPSDASGQSDAFVEIFEARARHARQPLLVTLP